MLLKLYLKVNSNVFRLFVSIECEGTSVSQILLEALNADTWPMGDCINETLLFMTTTLTFTSLTTIQISTFFCILWGIPRLNLTSPKDSEHMVS